MIVGLRRARHAISVLLLALAIAGCSPSTPKFRATDITGSKIGGNFELPDHSGKIQRLSDYRGRIVIVSFGFTSCPDVCPTTLQTIADALTKLGPDAAKVQLFMITVDPARDTPAKMSQYVTSFSPRFIGLVPDESDLKKVAAQFKVFINRNKPGAGGFYTVDHSTAAFVFDGQGQIRLFVSHDAGSDSWLADLRALIAQAG